MQRRSALNGIPLRSLQWYENNKNSREEEEMTVKIRFFARFRELLGTDIVTDVAPG